MKQDYYNYHYGQLTTSMKPSKAGTGLDFCILNDRNLVRFVHEAWNIVPSGGKLERIVIYPEVKDKSKDLVGVKLLAQISGEQFGYSTKLPASEIYLGSLREGSQTDNKDT